MSTVKHIDHNLSCIYSNSFVFFTTVTQTFVGKKTEYRLTIVSTEYVSILIRYDKQYFHAHHALMTFNKVL